MAISIEAFLVLEQSLVARNTKITLRKLSPSLLAIFKAIDAKDYYLARSLISDIEFSLVDTAYLHTIGLSAVIFGASRVTPKVKASTSTLDPEESGVYINSSKNMVVSSLNALGGAIVLDKLNEVVTLREQGEVKAFRRKVIRGIAEAMMKDTTAINSLHVSRLASFGMLQEATNNNLKTYRITAQLDNSTCPVCQTLNGKTFSVGNGLQRVKQLLTVVDGETLKTLAPFPKQDKLSVTSLKDMDTSTLEQEGFTVPPFHPRCRCTLIVG